MYLMEVVVLTIKRIEYMNLINWMSCVCVCVSLGDDLEEQVNCQSVNGFAVFFCTAQHQQQA